MNENEIQGPLHIRYRPTDFSEFIGNESTVQALKSVLNRDKKDQIKTYLFFGPSGCGKTTLARIVSKELGCSEIDFSEYNVANTRGIETIRDIIKGSRYSPMEGDIKVYLLDECHKLTSDAQNALLKILEDTPDHVRFILCTTEENKLIVTIRNRATAFPVNRLTRPVMIGFLKSIAAKEEIQFPDNFYKEIASVSEGSPRAALAIMDKIIDIEDDQAAFDAIASATFDEVEVKKLIDFLMTSGKKDWKTAANILKGLDLTGGKPEELRVAVARYFGSVLLNKGDSWTHQVMVVFGAEPWFYSGREKLFDAIYVLCH
jgi:DNA polymerase III subunit gamma/tau